MLHLYFEQLDTGLLAVHKQNFLISYVNNNLSSHTGRTTVNKKETEL